MTNCDKTKFKYKRTFLQAYRVCLFLTYGKIDITVDTHSKKDNNGTVLAFKESTYWSRMN
jgi:hypothetical protein